MKKMRGKRFGAIFLSACIAASLLSGCASRANVTEDMIPAVTDLRKNQETPESVAEVMGLSMNKSYVAELTRLDGDNTEMASVQSKEVPVVLKATSVDKDLKVKIVNKKNDRVITGTKFEVSVTDANNKSKTYQDDDKDGVIYIKEMAPGKCKISMKDAGAYKAPEAITADVKANIDYKMVDITDEIKKESEINVSKEDSNTNGNAGAGNSVILTDTVEFVASSKTEIMKQKVDEFGTPMYEKILKEPAKFHKDSNKDGICDRCGAKMETPHEHSYTEAVTKEAACTEEGEKTLTCSCGDKKTEKIPALGHDYQNGICTRCKAEDGSHVHNYQVVTEPTCGTPGKEKCSSCGKEQEIPATGEHSYGEDGKCTGCEAVKPVDPPAQPLGENEQSDKITPVGALLRVRGLNLLRAEQVTKIVYDTGSKPIMEGTGTYKYTGWQTIDGATYYFDKNGNKVTGSQVIQGIQYTFSSSGVRSGTIGIDVSKFQSSINWKKVKNAGINFAIIRCGYRGYGSGVLVEDPMFASHISGAKAAGLRVGVYFFSQAISEAEAVEEASMAVKLANRYGINMPIAIDSEYANGGAGRADGLSKSARTKITRAFCNTVANSGHTPMVYASKAWFSDHLDVSQLGSCRIWVAHYAASCGYTGRYDIWQNTSKGKVDGVSGNVDMNISSI